MQSLLGLPNYGTNIGFMTFFEVQGGPTKFSKQGATSVVAAAAITHKRGKSHNPDFGFKMCTKWSKVVFFVGQVGHLGRPWRGPIAVEAT